MKFLATGRVTAYYIEPNGERRLLFKDRPNALGSDMIGRLCSWIAKTATSSPVTHVGMTYGTTEVYTDGIANVGPTAVGETGYKWVSTGTWTNNTGAEKTIASGRLLNRDNPDAVLEYATVTGLSEAVGIGAGLEFQWTVTLQQNASGGTGIPVLFFSRLCQLFCSATATAPITTAIYTPNAGDVVSVTLGDPTSGGAVTSTNIVWQAEALAPTGAATLSEIALYDNAGTPLLCDNQTGFSDSWSAGNYLTDTITLTPVTV